MKNRRKTDVTAKWIEAHEQSDKLVHELFQKTQDAMLDEIKGLREDIKPLLTIYTGTTFGGRFIMKAIAFLGALSALVFGWFGLIKH